MRTLVIVAAAAATFALALAPTVAGAQTNSGSSEHMKGPPNSNGYDDKNKAATSPDTAQPESASKMKGPPNANGMQNGMQPGASGK